MLDYYRFKEVLDLFQQGKPDEARTVLSELQTRYIEVCDENTLLKSQLQEFEDILYLAKNLVYDGFHYWLMTGTIKQGPFCQHCYDKTGQLIRLNDTGHGWKCFTCGTRYPSPDDQDALPGMASEKAASGKVIPLYK